MACTGIEKRKLGSKILVQKFLRAAQLKALSVPDSLLKLLATTPSEEVIHPSYIKHREETPKKQNKQNNRCTCGRHDKLLNLKTAITRTPFFETQRGETQVVHCWSHQSM